MNLQTSKIDDLLAFDFKQSQATDYRHGRSGQRPGAGPVYAAAVYFPKVDAPLKKQLELLNDSKKLSPTDEINWIQSYAKMQYIQFIQFI
jgi:hypothetical protein